MRQTKRTLHKRDKSESGGRSHFAVPRGASVRRFARFRSRRASLCFCAPNCPAGAKAGDNRWVLLWAFFPLFLPRREPTPAAPCPLFFPLSRRLLWFRVRTCRRRKLWVALWACPPTSLFSLSGSVFAALPCAALCGGFRPRTPAILLRAGLLAALVRRIITFGLTAVKGLSRHKLAL